MRLYGEGYLAFILFLQLSMYLPCYHFSVNPERITIDIAHLPCHCLFDADGFFCLDSPLELTVFDLTPSTNQIVFAGDKLPFQCRASLLANNSNMMMSWQHDGAVVVSNRSLGIFIHSSPVLADKLLMTTMVLERLVVAHSGTWKCVVESLGGNVSKSVNVVVLAEDTGYCSPVVMDTSRGRYSWPRTLAGVVQVLPCVVSSLSHLKTSAARYTCDVSAVWTDLDVSRCSYISQMTRDLENMSRVFHQYFFGACLSILVYVFVCLTVCLCMCLSLPHPLFAFVLACIYLSR